MTSSHGNKALARADAKVQELLERSRNLQAGSVALVDAPAGAGKTGLVTRLVPRHVKEDRRVGVITQTNEQADDLTRRLAREQPKLAITRLVRSGYQMDDRPANVTVVEDARNLRTDPVVIATADKWAFSAEKLKAGAFDIGLIDEAYQMAGGKLLYSGHLFGALEMVGDPGQLSPFSQVDTERWAGLSVDPTRNAVDTIRYYLEVPSDSLPVTRRLPASAAGIVKAAFYDGLEFSAATELGARQLGMKKATGRSAASAVTDTALTHGWAVARLPQRAVQRNDQEIAHSAAAIAKDLLTREAHRVHDEDGRLPKIITPDRIALGASHRDQVAALRAAAESLGIDGVVVDTANRLQGREFDVVIAWHPLSGQVEASAFHLDVGRLCVLTTRHRHACILVGRDGIEELLEMSVPAGEGLLGETMDRSISGWQAHLLLLGELAHTEVKW